MVKNKCKMNICSRKIQKLKPINLWVIKHKRATHPVVRGVYDRKDLALKDYVDMPEYDEFSCSRKCYEIVKIKGRLK